MASKELDQRHAEERASAAELKGAVLRRHFQVHGENAAILRLRQHHALEKLKRLREQGVVLPGFKST